MQDHNKKYLMFERLVGLALVVLFILAFVGIGLPPLNHS